MSETEGYSPDHSTMLANSGNGAEKESQTLDISQTAASEFPGPNMNVKKSDQEERAELLASLTEEEAQAAKMEKIQAVFSGLVPPEALNPQITKKPNMLVHVLHFLRSLLTLKF